MILFFFENFGNIRFWILGVGFLVFHDGFLISDVGFLSLNYCIFLNFWKFSILDFGYRIFGVSWWIFNFWCWFFDFIFFVFFDFKFWIFGFWILEFWILCIKIPYPLCGLPQGLFFLEKWRSWICLTCIWLFFIVGRSKTKGLLVVA